MTAAQNGLAHGEYHKVAEAWVFQFPELEPHVELISKVASSVEEYMSNPEFDSSHDFAHIRRVVALAKHIYATENGLRKRSDQSTGVLVVVLAALLHDVDDRKYAVERLRKTSVHSILNQLEVDRNTAFAVEEVVKNVSYSEEVKNPNAVQKVLLQHPELAYVQDADRLDALGAIGTARCFTYSAAKGRDMNSSFDHFPEKLLRLESMMKTTTGQAIAAERTRRMREFLGWWKDEKSVEDQKSLSSVS